MRSAVTTRRPAAAGINLPNPTLLVITLHRLSRWLLEQLLPAEQAPRATSADD